MAPKKRILPITIENGRLLFKNFAGKKTQYNEEGNRNFCVVLEDKNVIDRMVADGFAVKELPPREEGDTSTYFLRVKANYRSDSPPIVVLINSQGRATLPEELLPMVDTADIEKVDLIINPYQWDVNGSQGTTAYLKSIYIHIREDELELKYADVPEIQGSVGGLDYTPHELEASRGYDVIQGEVV